MVPGLLVGLDRGVGQAAVEEVERFGILLPDGGPHAAVVPGDELDEEVLQLGRLRRIREGRVVRPPPARPTSSIRMTSGLKFWNGALRADVQAR